MSETQPISDAESLVMEVLWDKHPRYSDEIITILCSQQDWQEATVKTLLNRLLNKGAITAEKQGRRYLYSPVLQRETWVGRESEGFLTRMFGGHLAPLVAHFSKHDKLSPQDLAEIKRLIEELEHGK